MKNEIIKNEITKNGICIIVVFIVLWHAGARFNFFPFIADDLVISAVGFTGLLIAIVIVICTCWIIDTIQNKSK